MITYEEFPSHTKLLLEQFKNELHGIRTNRPHTGLVEDIKVSVYDAPTPIKHIASVGIQPPRDIVIEPWDKSLLPAIAKAIETSSLGLGARADGTMIRVSLPGLSHERREELIKHVKRVAEEVRIKLRHGRDEANKDVAKMAGNATISEDGKFQYKNDIQKTTDETNKEIERMVEEKIKEINI